MYIPTHVHTHTCTYPHMYIPTHVRTHICTFSHMYIPLPTPHICIPSHIHTLTCTYPHMYVPTYVRSLTCTYPHMYIPSHVHTRTCTYPHMYIPAHVHTHTYTTYVHTHTCYIPSHVHTHTCYIPSHVHTHTCTYHTLSGCMGDTQFHFRLRCSGSGAGGTEVKVSNDHANAPLVLMVSKISFLRVYWYGTLSGPSCSVSLFGGHDAVQYYSGVVGKMFFDGGVGGWGVSSNFLGHSQFPAHYIATIEPPLQLSNRKVTIWT